MLQKKTKVGESLKVLSQVRWLMYSCHAQWEETGGPPQVQGKPCPLSPKPETK